MSQVFTTLDAALANIDVATSDQDAKTTALEAEIAAVRERVKKDDLEPGELDTLLAHVAASAGAISANATRISDASAIVATVEADEVVPPVEEIPPIEEIPPVEG